MLEKIDLDRKMKKAEYESVVDELKLQLGEVQRKARDARIPVIIVFEGLDAAGKGTLINRLLLNFDSRGFEVHTTLPASSQEQMFPFLRRYWLRIPEHGKIAIFDRSWYQRVLLDRVDRHVKRSVWRLAYTEINTFEQQLIDDKAVIIKFYLHISKKEQKNRFKQLQSNPVTAWRVTATDLKHHYQYNQFLEAAEEMLQKTNTRHAPWTVVGAHDPRLATITIYRTVLTAMEDKLKALAAKPSKAADKKSVIKLKKVPYSMLDKADLSLDMTQEAYETALKKYQDKIRELEFELYLNRVPVVIAYEGWDAGGKGGNIRRLVQALDPRGYQVIPVAAPNDIEKAHHYLWRFWRAMPKAGHIALFDRTWYGRVLVERIEGFCSEADWKRAYGEINEMERQLTNFGAVIVKFWIHISQEEQLARFEARQALPEKQWKITDEDWRNREKWDVYKVAVDEMLYRTSTPHAPWTIIEGNSKLHARIKSLKTVVDAIEKQI